MMSDLYWLTDEQMARLQPYFPKSHGRARVDDRDAPREYGRQRRSTTAVRFEIGGIESRAPVDSEVCARPSLRSFA